MLCAPRDFVHLNPMDIEREIQNGYISRQELPGTGLAIYNYTNKTQWEWRWTPETMACRGLIVNGQGQIVARPFPKFFGIEQLDGIPLPNEPFEVCEKVDGSLGILYWVGDSPRIATRGSFVSDQAVVGTRILQRYDPALFRRDVTYLFEIIYPQNRIVVDYGAREDLVLLATIETATGTELPLAETRFPVVARRYDLSDIDAVLSWAEPNTEGFVVRFASGVRVKVKTAEYKRLHRLVTGVNSKTIWEVLSSGGNLDDIVDRVPDEFYSWVRSTETDILTNYAEIESRCKNDFRTFPSRKDAAAYFQTCQYPSILFNMLDGRPYSGLIWKLCKPKASSPFRTDEA